MLIFLKLILAVILGSIGQLCFKLGSASFKGSFLDHIMLFMTNKFLISGLTLYGLSTLIYVTTLQKIDLSIAYPVISLSYVLVLILSYFILGENLSLYKIIGSFMIIGGVAVLWIK